MDVLLFGKLTLPFAGEAFCRIVVQRHLPMENVPGKSNTIPGLAEKCLASARNRVQVRPDSPVESQARVIEAEAVEHRCLKIVDA
jgi:hypothetical protein